MRMVSLVILALLGPQTDKTSYIVSTERAEGTRNSGLSLFEGEALILRNEERGVQHGVDLLLNKWSLE